VGVLVPYKDPEVRKQKLKEYSRKHYETNREAVKARTAGARRGFRKVWDDFKRKQVCIKCGFAHPAAIDFHHVQYHPDNQKLYKLLQNRSFKAALEEVKKCVPLCANCHRIHHYDERKALERARRKKKTT
jgi:hypothetical protein